MLLIKKSLNVARSYKLIDDVNECQLINDGYTFITCRYAPPTFDNYEDLERKYWKNVTFSPPIYGADISGTIYDEDQNLWNIGRLGTILDCVAEDYGVKASKNELSVVIL